MNYVSLTSLLLCSISFVCASPIPEETLSSPTDSPIANHELVKQSTSPALNEIKTMNDDWVKSGFLEIRGAYFLPIQHTFRTIYCPTFFWGLEWNGQLYQQLYGWIGANYLRKHGHTIPDHSPTTLTMVPLSLGLKWIYNSYRVQPYLGVGQEITYEHEKTNSNIFVHSRSNWSYGGIFKIGFLVYATHHLFLDFYTDYSLRTLRLQKLSSSLPQWEWIHSIDLSGFNFGAGLGYGF